MEIVEAEDRDLERVTGDVFVSSVGKREGIAEDLPHDLTLSVNEVIFEPGERTEFHKHTIRQVLYVTGGRGIVATEDEERTVTEGDVISFPPEEPHWHGATDEDEFRHLSIVVRDPETGGTVALPDF